MDPLRLETAPLVTTLSLVDNELFNGFGASGVSSERSTPGIEFTAAAAARIKYLGAEKNNQALKLRVSISGGGCNGFQYGFDLVEAVYEGDTLVNTQGALLVVDPISLQYLDEATVDYLEGLEGSRFIVNNPKAKITCGCGSSFTL